MLLAAVILVALAILAFETALALRAGGCARRTASPLVAITALLTTGVVLLLVAG